jgi:hypothetical protein
LAALLLQLKCGQEAVGIVNNLLRELKKLDDKQMLVEVHLVESRIHHSLLNIPKGIVIFVNVYEDKTYECTVCELNVNVFYHLIWFPPPYT